MISKFNTSGAVLIVACGLLIAAIKPVVQGDRGYERSSDDDRDVLFQSTQVNANQISDRYSLHIDAAAKQQLGDQTFNEISMFLQTTQKALEAKDAVALMAQYSDRYRDGDLDKKSVEQAWRRIFARVDTVAALNNMKVVNISADRNMVVLQSSGLLLGVPGDERWPVTIDNWNNEDHILVKESGAWKLIGIYGPERKRLWFDKPTHPLI